MTTRRSFLGGVAGAFVAAVVGVKPKLQEHSFMGVKFFTDQTEPVIVKPLPAWSVGDGGEMNWKVIFAETKEEAIRQWCIETHDEDPGDPCDCGCGTTHQECGNYGYSLPECADRSEYFDHPLNAEPTQAELFNAGWMLYCDKCGNEISKEDGESDIGDDGKPKCHDCMSDEELRKVCPDHYRFDEEEEDA